MCCQAFANTWHLYKLARGEQRCKVLPAPQGEEEGEDVDQALQICRTYHARGAALIVFCTRQILAQNFATY